MTIAIAPSILAADFARLAEQVADCELAGADRLIAHLEVVPDPWPLFADAKARGRKVGLALNPGTSIERITPFLNEIDLALCMTVNPGFAGQAYLPESPERIRRLRELIDRAGVPCELEVDGGIDL